MTPEGVTKLTGQTQVIAFPDLQYFGSEDDRDQCEDQEEIRYHDECSNQ